MRSPHHFQGIFDMAPFLSLIGVALGFGSHRLLCSFCDCRQAVLLEHLPCDGMNLSFGHHVSLLVSAIKAVGRPPAAFAPHQRWEPCLVPRPNPSEVVQDGRIEPVGQRNSAIDRDRGTSDIGRDLIREDRERHRREILATTDAAERNVPGQ